jgi:hypothetical protein
MGRRRLPIAAIAALGAALIVAPPAQATFHLISIREVYPGSVAHPDSGYVELQAYASGQNFVGGHSLTVYDAGGTSSGTFSFVSGVANGANQMTILIGDSDVEGTFGVMPDLPAPDLEIGSGGAACWAGSLDCVSWGGFTGSTPSASGSPADPLGIPDGMALRRTIEPGCPTLLEAADDSNDSATDFFDATPQPRSNASAIVETACTGPTTTIDSKPPDPTNATGASFTYHATPASTSFECRLDAAAFAGCPSGGVEYAGPLAEGSHTFRVRAEDANGFTGPAASYGWRVDTTAPAAIIDGHPTDPSPGASATFQFHAGETGSSFECSLAAGAAADSFSACSWGKTYTGLADGEYTFKVRATDPAGNQGEPAAFSWTVDNSLADTTPPETTIDSKPPDPSGSSTASFAYHSNEPGSSFECSFDGAGFAACPSGGIQYTGLADGSHAFQVRAVDTAHNVDPTPAGYTFAVAVPPPATAPPPSPAPAPAVAPVVAPVAPAHRRHRRRRCGKHRGKHRGRHGGRRRGRRELSRDRRSGRHRGGRRCHRKRRHRGRRR